MGCYGIGVGRTLAAAIEQNHDEEGIRFPFPLAPFSVIITPVNVNDPEIRRVSEGIYRELQNRNIEVLLDDRDERPGRKFKDADLIGIPLRVTIGPKRLEEGKLDVKLRKEKQAEAVPVGEVVERVVEILKHHGVF